MKVNFNVNALDFNGKEIKLNDQEVNMSDEIQKIMFFAGNNGGRQLNNDEKYLAYKIGKKLAQGADEFSAEELAFIKEQSSLTLAAGMYGFLVDLIENGNK